MKSCTEKEWTSLGFWRINESLELSPSLLRLGLFLLFFEDMIIIYYNNNLVQHVRS